MILGSGIRSVNIPCPCGTMHFNVQIGEEALACHCGNTLRFNVQLSGKRKRYEYSWTLRKEAATESGEVINGDKRNLS